MLKKIIKTIRALFIGIIWTSALLYVARLLMIYIWKFDIFYVKQWSVVKRFWNNNGVIDDASDYAFFLSLLLILIIWIVGGVKLCRLNYAKLMIAPLNYIANRDLKKYEQEDTHVVIKNIKVGEKISVEDLIQERIKQEQTDNVKESDEMRRNISEKIINRKEQ